MGTLPHTQGRRNRRYLRGAVALLLATPWPAWPLTPQQQALPSLASLVASVQANQRTLDKVRESYTYRETQLIQELDSHGAIKKQETREDQVFFVNGHPIERLVRKDGKPLAGDADTKENAHIQFKVQQAEHTPPGQLLNTKHEVSVSWLLTAEHFSNERRVFIDNRPTIAIDFTGNRDIKSHGIAEDASKRLDGTVWIDEQAHEVRRIQAMLDSNFHLEMGLVSLSKGSSFAFEQKLINNQVWLPTGALIHIEARAALFLGYHIAVHVTDDHYQQFHAAATQQAAATQ